MARISAPDIPKELPDRETAEWYGPEVREARMAELMRRVCGLPSHGKMPTTPVKDERK